MANDHRCKSKTDTSLTRHSHQHTINISNIDQKKDNDVCDPIGSLIAYRSYQI